MWFYYSATAQVDWLPGANWRDYRDFIALVDHDRFAVIIIICARHINIVQVDRDETAVEHVGRDALITGLERLKQLLEWKRRGQSLDGLARVRAGTGKVQNVEVPAGGLGRHDVCLVHKEYVGVYPGDRELALVV